MKGLLEKYLEGQTTLEEERQLRAWYKDRPEAEGAETLGALFAAFEDAGNESMKETVALPFEKQSGRLRRFRFYRIAAVVVVALGVGFYFVQSQTRLTPEEQEEAMAAYQKTRQALEVFSTHYNSVTAQLTHIDKFEKATHKVFKP